MSPNSMNIKEVRIPKKYIFQIVEIIIEPHVILNDIKKVCSWLNTKNLNFGGIKPITLIAIGKGHKVLQFIKDAREGNMP